MPYPCFAPHARRAYAPALGFEVFGDILSSLIDESVNGGQKTQRPTKRQQANPHFDVYETANHYVVEGELPGVSDKKTFAIEFNDSVLSVSGAISRGSQTLEEEETIEKQEVIYNEKAAERADSEMTDATLQADTATTAAPGNRVTVEETADEDDNHSDFEVVHTPRSSTTNINLPAEKPANPESSSSSLSEKKTEKPKKAAGPKYWVTERSVGQFTRKFKFPGLVDQQGVKATLENGILSISVPKRDPYVRRVNIE